MDGSARMGRPAVAGTHRHPGLAGHCASALDLYRAHGPPPACPAAKTAAGWNACARGDRDRLCRPQLLCVGLSDFFLTYTSVASPHVLGVQGRYFVIALPVAAIFMASLINLELPRGVPALVAITGSMIAGVTSVDAVLKAHW